MLPVKRGGCSPNSAPRMAEWMPSAPTMRSASNALPSAKVAAAPCWPCTMPVQAAARVAAPGCRSPTRMACRSARWTCRNGAPYRRSHSPASGVRHISRAVRQLRPTRDWGVKLTARRASSSPKARMTFTALGVIWMPAPTAPKAARTLEHMRLDPLAAQGCGGGRGRQCRRRRCRRAFYGSYRISYTNTVTVLAVTSGQDSTCYCLDCKPECRLMGLGVRICLRLRRRSYTLPVIASGGEMSVAAVELQSRVGGA